MKVGEKKTVDIDPDQGYGPRDPQLAQRVPLDQLPEGIEVGAQLSAAAGDKNFPVWVTELDEKEAVVDANHPLAGRNLVFDLEIVSINDA